MRLLMFLLLLLLSPPFCGASGPSTITLTVLCPLRRQVSCLGALYAPSEKSDCCREEVVLPLGLAALPAPQVGPVTLKVTGPEGEEDGKEFTGLIQGINVGLVR